MISVLIPAYNCRPWIEEALRSVAGQTLPPGEILVADDASTDGTADFVESLAIPGVRVLRSERNQGISRQLNRLIEEAKGRRLARMDGDDIAHPDRFRLQIEAMERRDVGIMGTWCRRFGASDTEHRFAESDEMLKAGLLFSVPFCHPTVIIDRDRLPDGVRYDSEYDLAEDYHLWTQLRKQTRYGNVPQVLFDWRMHERNAGTAPTTAPRQKVLSTRIRKHLLDEYGMGLTDNSFDILDKRAKSMVLDLQELHDYAATLKSFVDVDPAVMGSTRDAMRTVVLEQWDLACAFSAWTVPQVPCLWMAGRHRLGGRVVPGVALKMFGKALLGRARRRS